MNAATGVYFKREDYAGFWRRLLIDVIDVFVVAVICLALNIVLGAAAPPGQNARIIFASWTVVVFCYFVILKRFPIGTVGYRVGGVRIVNLEGRPPSWLSLVVRLGFGFLGPLNVLIDLLWLSGDIHRQALRDKLANTYVVKRQAQPAGSGRVVFRNYDILGFNFMFREIEIRAVADPGV